MGILDDAIREHLELKRRLGASSNEIERLEGEAFGAASRPGEPDFPEPATGEEALEPPTTLLDEPPPGTAGEDGPAVSRERPSEEHPVGDPITGEEPVGDPSSGTPDEPQVVGAVPFDLESTAVDIDEPPAEEPLEAAPLPAYETGEQVVESDQEVAPAQDVEPGQMFESDQEVASDEPLEPDRSVEPEQPLEPDEGAPLDFDDIELSSSESLDPMTDEAPLPPVETTEHGVAEPPAAEEAPGGLEAPLADETETEAEDDVLEETPDFLREQPEDDDLWFEQGEPKDFDFDD
ncbi:MAG: hypothetical protein H0W09_04885 [Solirubrobacterales bacterium]|nr:hypothetical protein [Solirubrobacterales bacterium]